MFVGQTKEIKYWKWNTVLLVDLIWTCGQLHVLFHNIFVCEPLEKGKIQRGQTQGPGGANLRGLGRGGDHGKGVMIVSLISKMVVPSVN